MKVKITRIRFYAAMIVIFLFFIGFESLFGDEVTELWTRLYNKAQSYQQKYDIMLNMVEIQSRDIIPTLVKALDELNQVVGVNKKDMEVVRKLKILIIKKLGELKAREAEDLIYDIVRNTKDPFVKSEALISLGKIGTKKYAQHIAMILKNLTMYRGTQNMQGENSIAYGCIYALERFKDPVGYLPVFLAANGGYSREVRDAARKALVNMVEDPSFILEGIIKNESSFKLKLAALESEDISKATPEKKVELAAVALDVGLSIEPANITEATQLRDLRINALKMFCEHKIKQKNVHNLHAKFLYLMIKQL